MEKKVKIVEISPRSAHFTADYAPKLIGCTGIFHRDGMWPDGLGEGFECGTIKLDNPPDNLEPHFAFHGVKLEEVKDESDNQKKPAP